MPAGLAGSLTAQYSFLGNPGSKRGLDLMGQKMHLPQKANAAVIVRSRTTGVTDPAFRAQVLALQSRIAALGAGVVDSVTSLYRDGGASGAAWPPRVSEISAPTSARPAPASIARW